MEKLKEWMVKYFEKVKNHIMFTGKKFQDIDKFMLCTYIVEIFLFIVLYFLKNLNIVLLKIIGIEIIKLSCICGFYWWFTRVKILDIRFSLYKIALIRICLMFNLIYNIIFLIHDIFKLINIYILKFNPIFLALNTNIIKIFNFKYENNIEESLIELTIIYSIVITILLIFTDMINYIIYPYKINIFMLLLVSWISPYLLSNEEIMVALIATIVGLIQWLSSEDSIYYLKKINYKNIHEPISIDFETKKRWRNQKSEALLVSVSIGITYAIKKGMPQDAKTFILDAILRLIKNPSNLDRKMISSVIIVMFCGITYVFIRLILSKNLKKLEKISSKIQIPILSSMIQKQIDIGDEPKDNDERETEPKMN